VLFHSVASIARGIVSDHALDAVSERNCDDRLTVREKLDPIVRYSSIFAADIPRRLNELTILAVFFGSCFKDES